MSLGSSIDLYQVDAFTDRLFSGNPAAVCPIRGTLSEQQMQSIATENNLSETAFIDLNASPFRIRWFTPLAEIDLCGHATLASARVLFDEYLDPEVEEIVFDSNSGELRVYKQNHKIFLDFPRDDPLEVEQKHEVRSVVERVIGEYPRSILRGRDDFLAVVDSQDQILSIRPDLEALEDLPSRGLIVSSVGDDVDFVSRCFFPKIGEDPVTGSAHTLMTPYWAGVLGKNQLLARQCSPRGGFLECELMIERVLIGGSTVRYLDGRIRF